MRIKLVFSKNTENVPNNQNVVNSYIHDSLGRNNKYHDSKSDYCISRMMGGVIVNGGRDVNYPNGGFIIVTSPDMEFLNNILLGVMNNSDFGYGMTFKNVINIEEKFYNGWNFFKTTDMGFILRKKTKIGEENKFWTLEDENFTDVVKEHIVRKFSKINPRLNFNNLKVEITKHPKHIVTKRYVKNVPNDTNVCQISIHADKNVAKTIYNYGLGQSTGSGFGTLYLAKNHHRLYV